MESQTFNVVAQCNLGRLPAGGVRTRLQRREEKLLKETTGRTPNQISLGLLRPAGASPSCCSLVC